MRFASLAVISLLLTSTAAQASAPAPVKGEQTACKVSVEKSRDGAGYQLARPCDKSATAKQTAASLAVARAPVRNGSQLDGENDGSTIILGLMATGLVIGGIIFASESDAKDLPVSN